MGFNDLDMVEYYQKQVDSAKEEIQAELTKKDNDKDKLRMLLRRYNQCKAALDLNKGLRQR